MSEPDHCIDPVEFGDESDSEYCIDCGCRLTITESWNYGGRCIICTDDV